METTKRVVVIGRGPAGLVATYDLSKRKVPVVCFEADQMVGGSAGPSNVAGVLRAIGANVLYWFVGL